MIRRNVGSTEPLDDAVVVKKVQHESSPLCYHLIQGDLGGKVISLEGASIGR